MKILAVECQEPRLALLQAGQQTKGAWPRGVLPIVFCVPDLNSARKDFERFDPVEDCVAGMCDHGDAIASLDFLNDGQGISSSKEGEHAETEDMHPALALVFEAGNE
jgi:hypothetical protein